MCAGVVLARPALPAAAEAITAKLSDWTKYPELKKYAAAFEYLKKTDFTKKELSRVDLDGNRMYATLSSIPTKAPESAKLEAHRKYLDIHYLVDGRETIGSVNVAGLEVTDPYKEASDVEFFKVPAKYRKIEMRPGHFAIFLPGQGHMPGLGTDTSAMIRKVVVKVQV